MGLSPYGPWPCPDEWSVMAIFFLVMMGIAESVYNFMGMLVSPLKLLPFLAQSPVPVTEMIDSSTENYGRSKVLVNRLKKRNPAVPFKKLHKKRGLRCTICLEKVDRNAPVHPLPCEHIFHASCLHQYVLSDFDTCPLCRAPLVQPKEHGRRRSMVPFW